ncbi:helix-turn-helix domain-containing protein [Micromonospora sp. NPDC051141]|uniref:helix-turn-helix domain-containing protein n=1 Tax=Micromonospora sp. NPDC051141 TaxID=3364284 RepID=UPI003794A5F2
MGGVELLPVGRVAYWRGRRKLSQQVFADRLGKSKSWVDKVERGVRSLDKLSTLQEVARVLRVDTATLLGRDVAPAEATHRGDGVERIRAALSRYEIPLGQPVGHRPVVPVDRMLRDVGYAWTTFQHARYPQLVDLVPGLLTRAQRTHAEVPAAGRVPLVEAYRITASLLLKLGDAELAWLAVDRAMLAATGDRELVAAAAVQLGQVLRALGRVRECSSRPAWRRRRTGTKPLPANCSTRPTAWRSGSVTGATITAPGSAPPPSSWLAPPQPSKPGRPVRRSSDMSGPSRGPVGGGCPPSTVPRICSTSPVPTCMPAMPATRLAW